MFDEDEYSEETYELWRLFQRPYPPIDLEEVEGVVKRLKKSRGFVDLSIPDSPICCNMQMSLKSKDFEADPYLGAAYPKHVSNTFRCSNCGSTRSMPTMTQRQFDNSYTRPLYVVGGGRQAGKSYATLSLTCCGTPMRYNYSSAQRMGTGIVNEITYVCDLCLSKTTFTY